MDPKFANAPAMIQRRRSKDSSAFLLILLGIALPTALFSQEPSGKEGVKVHTVVPDDMRDDRKVLYQDLKRSKLDGTYRFLITDTSSSDSVPLSSYNDFYEARKPEDTVYYKIEDGLWIQLYPDSVIQAEAYEEPDPRTVRIDRPIDSLGGVKLDEEMGEPKSPPCQGMVFEVVEDEPEFPGGEAALWEFITDTLTYPEAAKKNGVEGTVYVRFIVDKKGRIREPEVMRGIGAGCDEEALRVLRDMPQWKPGKQRGRKVCTGVKVPIRFTLE